MDPTTIDRDRAEARDIYCARYSFDPETVKVTPSRLNMRALGVHEAREERDQWIADHEPTTNQLRDYAQEQVRRDAWRSEQATGPLTWAYYDGRRSVWGAILFRYHNGKEVGA